MMWFEQYREKRKRTASAVIAHYREENMQLRHEVEQLKAILKMVDQRCQEIDRCQCPTCRAYYAELERLLRGALVPIAELREIAENANAHDYRLARGALRGIADDEPSETSIGRLRDEEDMTW